MDFDVGRVSLSHQGLVDPENESVLEDSPETFVNRIREFFRTFRINNAFIYRDQLLKRWRRNEPFLEVNISHLNTFESTIVQALQVSPFSSAFLPRPPFIYMLTMHSSL